MSILDRTDYTTGSSETLLNIISAKRLRQRPWAELGWPNGVI
uniref:Uncharacterized protein n=1 Tax=Physcomitrium patens TaxID=3218 RepID=A0A2K1IN79_PHYPA|nr:hypothetical protein PHYPA_027055 [Physcomitrium patens]